MAITNALQLEGRRTSRQRSGQGCFGQFCTCMHTNGALVHFRTLVTIRRVRVGLELRSGLVRVIIRVRIRLGLDLGLGLG